jgi:hypothetical protein
MKLIKRLSLIAILFAALFLASPTAVFAQSGNDNGQVVIGGTFNLKSGDTLSGDLVILGGQGTTEAGSTVDGNIFITGGTLTVSGTVTGDISSIGGYVILSDSAVIEGDVNLIGAQLERNNATIEGNVNVSNALHFNFTPPIISAPSPVINGPQMFLAGLKPVGEILWVFLNSLVMAALAALLVLLLPRPVERVAQSIASQPAITGGLGLLTIIVAPALLILLMITIILIPIGLLGILALAVGAFFGWIALGYEVGKRFAVLIKQNWAAPVSAGIGTLALTLITGAASKIPCVGWIIPGVVIVFALGGIVISRFGTQIYGQPKPITPAAPMQTPMPPAVPVPPSEPGFLASISETNDVPSAPVETPPTPEDTPKPGDQNPG